MHIETLPLTQLKPAPYNPRVDLDPGSPAYQRIARSLDEFDLVQPLVWNRRTGHVVGGHQRLRILTDQNREQVQCVVVDLPLEREKALNVTLNNKEVAGDWQPDKLIGLIEELVDVPDFDATLTGFDEQALNDLLLAPAPVAPADEESDDTDRTHVTVTLEIPREQWPLVKADLDDLLSAQPSIRTHIRGAT